MRILMVDDCEPRRETLAAHTGAEVVRVMPRALFDAPDLLHDADAIALDHDMCEAADDHEPCPSNPRGNCACHDGQEVTLWLMQRLGTLKDGCRVVVVSANPVGAQRMLAILRHIAPTCARRVHVEQCSAARWGRYDTTTRRNIRAAFGLPLDWEATP